MNLSRVSDATILDEYVKRFTIPAGANISSSKSAANHLRAYFADAGKKEKVVVCFLNGQNKVLTTEVLFQGSLTSSAVYPREVVTRVIELGAAAFVWKYDFSFRELLLALEGYAGKHGAKPAE